MSETDVNVRELDLTSDLDYKEMMSFYPTDIRGIYIVDDMRQLKVSGNLDEAYYSSIQFVRCRPNESSNTCASDADIDEFLSQNTLSVWENKKFIDMEEILPEKDSLQSTIDVALQTRIDSQAPTTLFIYLDEY